MIASGMSVSKASPPQQQQDQGFGSFMNGVLPGVNNLTSSATSNISQLLNGLPSPSAARTTNAYWGVGAGTPAAGAGGAGDVNSFIGQRGTDLYGQQAQANQQLGLNNLLSMVGQYSQPALSYQGQQQQNTQFNQNLGQQQNQFNQNHELAKFDEMLKALQTGKNIVGGLPGNITL